MEIELVKPKIELVSMTKDPLKVIEGSARTCYKSEGKIREGSAEILIEKLVRLGHHAMIEFADAHYLITGNRGYSHEIVRMRLCSFAQESTRWCDYKDKKIQFIDLREYIDRHDDYNIWLDSLEKSAEAYKRLRHNGISPEIARSVLPIGLKADINVKANFRQWLHIFEVRCHKAAHPEMRAISKMILKDLHSRVPIIFDDLYEKFIVKGE